MKNHTREIRLAARPSGRPTPGDFDLATVDLPEPAEGQALVRNLFMSVDPYMRGRMNDVESYVPPFELGKPLEGAAVGEVVDSRTPALASGDLVLHGYGWREHAIVDGTGARQVQPVEGLPLSVYLGALGMPGLTAYAGLVDVAAFKEGDVVFVSAAAGAVGSLVGQLAKLKGAARVIGSAGSPEKVEYLTGTLGFDAAFDYKARPVAEQLAEAAPDGIDVYFDNVGADHLEAAIGAMRLHGRAAICGMIATYNATEPPCAPRNLALLIGRRITLRGMLVRDHADRMPNLVREVGGWLRDGRLIFRETVVDGLENAPRAFIDMLDGANTGKMIVRL
jgi:NADPH-dependent curcumin reductase CurA